MAKRRGRPITMQEPFKTLALKAGGVEALAEEIGTSLRSISRWGVEEAPGRISRPYRILLAQVAKHYDMAHDLEPWTKDAHDPAMAH